MKKERKDILIGEGLGLAGAGLSSVNLKRVLPVIRREATERDKEILKGLLEKYLPKGVDFHADVDAGTVKTQLLKDMLHNNGITKFDKILDTLTAQTGPATIKNAIYASGSKTPEIIAHEVGHNRFMNGLDGKTGQIIHKLMVPSKSAAGILGPTAGIISGVRRANIEDKGLEESKLNKHAAWAVPALLQLPTLAGETAASLNGLKKLEALGAFANEAGKLAAQKNLAAALGTYAGHALAKVGSGLVARGLAYKIQKARLKKKKEKKFSGYDVPIMGCSYKNAQIDPYYKLKKSL